MDKTELLKEYGDTGNKIKPRSFVSFYDYNRTTCGWLKYIFGADIHTYRRIVWIIVFCTGFIYSVCKESSRVISIMAFKIYQVGSITKNYLEYAYSIKEKIVTTSDEFPVITICLK